MSARQAAIDILRDNDRGGYTIPTPRLYPYQWNWDSAFAALGFAEFDRARAWAEIELLFEGQWANGMVPHIIFRRNDPDYFPGPGIWATNTTPPSSGHSQPPVVASVVAELVRRGGADDLQHGRELFPKLLAYHRWYHDARDPDHTGLVAITHPWESGRDNCPDWDGGMANIRVPDDLGSYERRDIEHVDASQRPSQLQYDRFLTLVKFGREHQWDPLAIYREGQFLMVDPGVQFILMRADRDLRELATALQESDAVAEIDRWLTAADRGCQALWNADVGAFCALDLKTGRHSDALTSASMLALYAGAGTGEQRDIMIAHAREIMQRVCYAFPSWDPRHPQFESQRYWRGPVWAVMNYMIALGLAESGEAEMAARVRNDTLALIDTAGYCEYFDALDGTGLGGHHFTWTAAIALALSRGDGD